jgi:EAL domain-containing protein (putative c-di-GMP-specific phosphodiesterase class I)
VETGDQAAVLRRLHCDEIQGFLVSPAVPAVEFAALLRAREAPRNAQATPA